MVLLVSRTASVPLKGRQAEFPRQLVHRSDPEDVFPTGWTRQTDTQFSVSARWPRAHRFFAPVTGRYQDPLLIAETMRQTTMLLAHAEFDVPVGDQFVMWELGYLSSPERLALGARPEHLDHPDGSWDITVDVSCSRIKRRGRGLGSMSLELLLHRSGSRIATGGGRISCTSAKVYERLRGNRRAGTGVPVPLLPPVAPREVGRASERDVVLAPTPRQGLWRLRLDTGHPTLFGRPNDHVPGVLLLEAARQAANAVRPGRDFLPVSLEAAFLRYVELDRPCWIEAWIVPADTRSTTRVHVRATQDGEPVFTSTLDSPDRTEEAQGIRP
ncbi:ScbA protein [Streptomyces sp. NBC_00121]|uniref:ScbA/BarX family gamma-butyrolactone biosynthesis protein n=1 Tax=unclassified Streptomyces TaxID=2593676 RepID=UPI002DD815CD|nr:ScbA/BarX family gamma-butyrolactone biosynthesis protein [Streptomyces sp. NBC_01760]WSC69126.1 ScbA protein [Streptomyces sp. NBC_01760]WTE59545.1 ScbA protein [Streptomyces sp. NBC_01617]